VLHGYDQAALKRRRAEFATLPEHEAALRLTAADRALEHLGLRTRLFAPPRWVISPGALAALPRVGFTLCADRTTIRDLATATMVHARVLEVGGGNTTEPWRCRAMVLGAGSTTRRGGLCRLGIDARHLNRSGPRQAVLDALDLALHHRRSRRPTSSPALRRRRRTPNPPRVSWATGPRRCLRHVRYRREEATPADGLVGLPVEQRLSDAANHRSRNLPE